MEDFYRRMSMPPPQVFQPGISPSFPISLPLNDQSEKFVSLTSYDMPEVAELTLLDDTTTETSTPSDTTTVTSTPTDTTTVTSTPTSFTSSSTAGVSTTTDNPSVPPKNEFSVTDGNITCIVAEFRMQFSVRYLSRSNVAKTAILYLPKLAPDQISGKCSGERQSLQMEWEWEKSSVRSKRAIRANKNTITMYMKKTGGAYAMDEIEMSIVKTKSQIPDLADSEEGKHMNASKQNLNVFEAPVTHSHLCIWNKDLNFNEELTMRMSDVHLQAYKTSGDDFDEAVVCPGPSEPDYSLEIAIGVIVAVAFISGLIAFIVYKVRVSRRPLYVVNNAGV
ncbi:lysosome-associated membrane glycoprotein 3 [Anabrus simplex]|uniref:lysosome-associated membrane glycoprotein 3 n=1 Tax=Anabrus simplex TaxID=316456 RepID=UPI0035A27A46